ncbi:Aste57867_14324 [Aphanomyces stellatus]|uniref:Aste57867_14324 protein n=1 Tax=Aphanomyces stellatus TaxID=120398 RepID=A0A485L173_9STRA|nr:hypothetical protein As57867_014270 [Aphanomyces stellatus]VFT91148.1 Aste57867_14324 [Aphanomyces stellatus]
MLKYVPKYARKTQYVAPANTFALAIVATLAGGGVTNAQVLWPGLALFCLVSVCDALENETFVMDIALIMVVNSVSIAPPPATLAGYNRVATLYIHGMYA